MKTKTIAVIIPVLYDKYHTAMWKPIVEACKEKNINVVLTDGGNLSKENGYSAYNITYQILNKNNVDGIIILSTSLCSQSPRDLFYQFVQRYKDLPVMSIGEQAPGSNCILVDNTIGLKEGIHHFVEKHRFKNICFITGPLSNSDATFRLNIFKETMSELNQKMRPEYIHIGRFTIESGKEAIYSFAIEKKLKFDAVIASNDQMAVGALLEMERLGIKVPRDVGLAGFDDLDEVQNQHPPFSTVRQPLAEMAYTAVDLISQKIDGKEIPEVTTLPTRFIVRESCGCISSLKNYNKYLFQKYSDPITKTSHKEECNILTFFDHHSEKFKFSGKDKEIIKQWFINYEKSCIHFLNEQNENDILKKVDTLPNHIYSLDIINLLADTLKDFFDMFIIRIQDKDIYQKFIIEFQKSINEVNDLFSRSRLLDTFSTTKLGVYLNYVITDVVQVLDLKTLFSLLNIHIPELELPSLNISLYKGEAKRLGDFQWDIPAYSTRIYSLLGKEQYSDIENKEHLTINFIPDHLKKNNQSKAYALMPLNVMHSIYYGYILFELTDCPGEIYEKLRNAVSSALKSCFTVKDLVEMKNKTEKISQYKSEFLANMSHEIRTPMNAILGFANILLKKTNDLEMIDHLKTINQAGKNLMGIINDILDFSKIEENKVDLEILQFSPEDLLIYLKNMFLSKINKKGLDFKLKFSNNMPEKLYGDERRLGQIIINILNNAIKFTEKGGITVECDYKENHLEIGIIDTGIGIPQEKQLHIFDPFSQVDASTTRKYGGTGLGLAICAQLIKLMNGSITLTSEIEKGSTFYMRIPLATEPDDNQLVTPVSTFRIDKENAEQWKNLILQKNIPYFILAVEDDKNNLKYLCNILKTLNVSFDTAENGKIALEKLQHKKYDLILLDVQMPVMDGTKLLEIIRKDDTLKSIYVIMLTAHALKGDREKYINAGSNDYMLKPIDFDILKYKIYSHIERYFSKQNMTLFDYQETNKFQKKKTDLDLTNSQKEKLIEIVNEIEYGCKFFEDKKLYQLANQLGELSHIKYFQEVKNNLYKHINNFDIVSINELMKNLKEAG